MTNLINPNDKLIESENFLTNINEKEIPEFLFLNEENFNERNFNCIKENEQKNESNLTDLKFSCSTPIKFDLDEGSSSDQSEQNRSRSNSNIKICNQNISNNEIKLECISSHKGMNISNDSLKLLAFESQNNTKSHTRGNFITSSLLEFEENEKLAANQSSVSSNSLFKAPINQMENMLKNLRNYYNYKEEDVQKSSKVSNVNHLDGPLITNNNTDNSNNIDSIINEILPLNVKYQQPEQQKGVSSYVRKNDHISVLESRLENEIVRRQHCEKQIHELNEHLLELQQQLAVAEGLDKKREQFGKNMDAALQKILENWKQKEIESEMFMNRIKHEKQNVLTNQTKTTLKNQFLEQEIKKLGDDLVLEKVKTQDYQNQISNLKNQMSEAEKKSYEKSIKIEGFESSISELTKEKDSYKQDLDLLKSKFDKNLKSEYETLIKEAKMVVEESEKQYNQLNKTIETEKLAKDTLQVEINMLEEKYENSVKSLTSDYENKINLIKSQSLEKEKAILETHKTEIEQLNSKAKFEIEKIKNKYYDDFQTKKDEYELKLTDLNLKIDSLQNEIDRLNRANKDLESERNTIRQNLKHTLELQMKETMQLLGLSENQTLGNQFNSNTHIGFFTTNDQMANLKMSNQIELATSSFATSNKKDEKQNADTFLENLKADIKMFNDNLTSSPKQIKPLVITEKDHRIQSKNNKVKSQLASASIADLMTNFNNSFQTHAIPNLNKSISNLSTATNLPNAQLSEGKIPKNGIKDSFILNQIDLINKYYQIDNSTLAAAAAVTSVSSTTPPVIANSNASLNTSQPTNLRLDNPSIYKSSNSINQQNIIKTQLNNKSVSNFSNFISINTSDDQKFNRSLSFSSSSKENNTESKSDKTPAKNGSSNPRTHELRHYIELLLNKSPSNSQVEANDKEREQEITRSNYQTTVLSNESKQDTKIDDISNSTSLSDTCDDFSEEKKVSSNGGYHDISDIDLGYTKRQSCEYYDDVKRNLNFDFDDSDDDQRIESISTAKPIETKNNTSQVKQVKFIEKNKLNTSNNLNNSRNTNSISKSGQKSLKSSSSHSNGISNQNLNAKTNSVFSLMSASSTQFSSLSNQQKNNQFNFKDNKNSNQPTNLNKGSKTSFSTLSLVSNGSSNRKIWK